MTKLHNNIEQIEKWGGMFTGESVDVFYISVSPELAQNLLDNNYVGQRNISEATVAGYISDMRKGIWNEKILDTIIKLTPDFKLLNGQHRMAAVIRYGNPVVMPFMFNVSTEEYSYLDNGKRRSAQNYIDCKYKSQVAALARIALIYETQISKSFGTATTSGSPIGTRTNVVKYANEHLHYLERIASDGSRMRTAVGCYGNLIYSFFIWVVKFVEDDEDLADFINDFCEAAPKNRTVQACKTKLAKTFAIKGQSKLPGEHNKVFAILFNGYFHFKKKDGIVRLDSNDRVLTHYELLADSKRKEMNKS